MISFTLGLMIIFLTVMFGKTRGIIPIFGHPAFQVLKNLIFPAYLVFPIFSFYIIAGQENTVFITIPIIFYTLLHNITMSTLGGFVIYMFVLAPASNLR